MRKILKYVLLCRVLVCFASHVTIKEDIIADEFVDLDKAVTKQSTPDKVYAQEALHKIALNYFENKQILFENNEFNYYMMRSQLIDPHNNNLYAEVRSYITKQQDIKKLLEKYKNGKDKR